MRQPSLDYKGDHRLLPATTCPYPSPATVSAVQMMLMATLHLVTQVIQMAPLQKLWQIHHACREKSPTAGTGSDMPTLQAVPRTTLQVHNMPTSLRKMPSHRHSKIPIGIRSLQDHSAVLTRPSVPASRTTTKSLGKLLPISGPSSQPKDNLVPAPMSSNC